jgi:hypothetical protein
MILEVIQYTASYLVTPSDLRPHIRSSVGLWSRANRCAKTWAPHEEKCEAFIRDAVADMRQRRTVVVLGSGLLRDVPIVELSKAFDTVVLVDLVHLASVRTWLRAKRLNNIRLISRDLGGLPETLAGQTPEPLAFLRQVPYLDLVVSANVLSQIGVGARRRLEKVHHAEPDAVVAQLIRAHLEALSGLPCRSLLLTDIRYKVTDRNGVVTEEEDLLCGVPPPVAAQRWNWTVAPFGELSHDCEAVHEVIAAELDLTRGRLKL